ncbi:hypothetical protein DFS34DRAFT_160611 [Phlyctochytrium arcticum]|nr:hypothetical protein DFS34DRAFT_160611 [Phlyctochytrium arcticum]
MDRPSDQPSDDRSPTTSDSSGHSLMDPPGYIKPDLQDLLLTDITAKELRVIAEAMEVDYLGPAAFPGTFPAAGEIWDPNHRLMVSLVCRRRTAKEAPARNVIFLIDTGSPSTYLCQAAMEAVIGKGSHLPQSVRVEIQSEKAIMAHLSPKGSHFADVNVLGMDFLAKNRVFPILNWDKGTFSLQ